MGPVRQDNMRRVPGIDLVSDFGSQFQQLIITSRIEGGAGHGRQFLAVRGLPQNRWRRESREFAAFEVGVESELKTKGPGEGRVDGALPSSSLAKHRSRLSQPLLPGGSSDCKAADPAGQMAGEWFDRTLAAGHDREFSGFLAAVPGAGPARLGLKQRLQVGCRAKQVDGARPVQLSGEARRIENRVGEDQVVETGV